MKNLLTILVAIVALGLGALLGYWVSGVKGDATGDAIEQDAVEKQSP